MEPLISGPLADTIHVGSAALCQKITQVDGAGFHGKACEPSCIQDTGVEMGGRESRERTGRRQDANLIAIVYWPLGGGQSWYPVFAGSLPVLPLRVVCSSGTPMSGIDDQSSIPM